MRGPRLMNGYHENPKATADSFIDGWLKTGDIGRVDKQGRIFIVDRQKVWHPNPSNMARRPFRLILRPFARISSRVNQPSVFPNNGLINQMTVRGWQVSPAEIEGVLLSHPNIIDAAVIGVKLKDAEAPKAFVIRNCQSLSEDTVKEYIATLLIGYKHLSGGVCFVDSIPKSASGKILRKLISDEAFPAKNKSDRFRDAERGVRLQ